MTPEERLTELGFSLPEAPAPVAAYVPAVRTGDLIFVSGQVPFQDGVLRAVGAVPDACSVEDATDAARLSGLNALAVLAANLPRGLSQVEQIVRLGVYVQSSPGFDGQPAVANGASELMQAVFGDAGRHARAAVGSIALPLDATVEVELVARVRVA
jgi:enamine deaminase RidA (YjgF/YER057c/UK114 family)